MNIKVSLVIGALVLVIAGGVVFFVVSQQKAKRIAPITQVEQTKSSASTTAPIIPVSENATTTSIDQSAIDDASSTLATFGVGSRSNSNDANALYDGQTVNEQKKLQAAVFTLYKAGQMGVIEDTSSTQLGVTALRVSYPPDQYCGIYGAPFCAVLLKHSDGLVEFLSVLNDGETAKEFIPEGLLTYASDGDGGGGFANYSLIDLQTKKRTTIAQESFEAGCASEVDTLTRGSFSVTVSSLETGSCAELPDIQIVPDTFATTTLHYAKPQGYQVQIDPINTLRNDGKLYFSLDFTSSTRNFVYDDTIKPPKLTELPTHAK